MRSDLISWFNDLFDELQCHKLETLAVGFCFSLVDARFMIFRHKLMVTCPCAAAYAFAFNTFHSVRVRARLYLREWESWGTSEKTE